MNNKIIRETSITIAVTNTQISEAIYTGQRSILFLKNISTAGEKISIAFGKEAVADQGIVLSQGDYITFSKDAGYYPSNLRVNAIASVGTAVLTIHEEIDEAI